MKRNKLKYSLLLLIFILILSSMLFYKNIIFQEGNPLPIINGIFKLNDNNTYVLISENPTIYLTKTNIKDDLFEYIKEEYDVKFKEQLGSGYVFEGDIGLLLTSRQYTRFYQVWRLSLVGDKLQ